MVREAMDFVKAYDPELGNMIEAEYKRQQRNIELIASENIVSEAVSVWQSAVSARYSAQSSPTFSRTRALRPTWRSIRRSASRATPLWA